MLLKKVICFFLRHDNKLETNLETRESYDVCQRCGKRIFAGRLILPGDKVIISNAIDVTLLDGTKVHISEGYITDGTPVEIQERVFGPFGWKKG